MAVSRHPVSDDDDVRLWNIFKQFQIGSVDSRLSRAAAKHTTMAVDVQQKCPG